jgi:type IV pilus assembly protein PilX
MTKNSPAPRERGAALVVALILMLVMTVLGVSGMSTATLELTMAGNAQNQQDAFQAAETGIDIAIVQSNFATGAVSVVPLTSVGAGETEAVTRFQQTTPVPDIAFSIGVGTSSVQAFHFDVTSVGRGPRGAESTHFQSFYVVGPGGN